MHPTLRKFFTALGVRTDHSFYLSQFRQRGGRQLSIFGLIFLFTFALNRFSGWLDNDIFGFQLQTVTNLFLTLSVCGIGWSALWMRTRSVKVQKNKIVLSLPFGQVEIPWSDIRDVEPIAFSTLYPIDEISLAQRQRLGRLYKRTGLRVRLKTAGLGWKRWLLPWPMLGEDPRTIFLLVNNWSKLAERIPEISNGRLVKRTAEANINLSNAPIPQISSNSGEKSKKQGVDLLFITPGGRHTKQLIQLVRQKYELAVARTPIDAVKKIRAVQPTLVIVDDQLLDESKLLGLVQSLQRQQHRFKSGYLCLTQSQIDPDLELELFDVGVKEMLDIRRGLQLTIKRIDFWLDWQGQVKNMARRNQELYGQNLYQRSELARHGELKHFLPKDVAQEVIDGVYNAESHRLRRQTVTVLLPTS